MKEFKIKPLVINNKFLNKFYENLLNNGYEIKVWDKKEDKIIYNYFLPVIRDYMFWTFELNNDKRFKNTDNEMKSAICNNYRCTMFIKDKIQIVSFITGIIFIIGEDKKEIQNIVDSEYSKNIQDINIDKDKTFKVSVEEEADLYSYIISLYKFITLMKLDKDMEEKKLFDINRKQFVKFIQEIYTKNITEKKTSNKLIDLWEKELGLDKLYISVENKFDLLYRNNKLNTHDNMIKIVIALLVILIIISTINLGNWII